MSETVSMIDNSKNETRYKTQTAKVSMEGGIFHETIS